jgi:hypothetical protein
MMATVDVGWWSCRRGWILFWNPAEPGMNIFSFHSSLVKTVFESQKLPFVVLHHPVVVNPGPE